VIRRSIYAISPSGAVADPVRIHQAKANLEGLGFKVRIFGNENGRVLVQNPGGGRLPQGSEIQILCA